jgi:hypothetical protein
VSRRILKHELRTSGGTVVDVGGWPQVLSVAYQGNALFVWVAAGIGGGPTNRLVFQACETGAFAPPLPPAEDGMEHVGTAHRASAVYAVSHVFMRREELP